MRLAHGEAHVWFARTSALLAQRHRLEVVLSVADRRRLAVARRPADRAPRTVAHGALRLLVARYLGQRPSDVVVRQACPRCGGRHGALHVPEIFASIAYAPAVTLFALARSPVGVDIEPSPPPASWARVACALSPSEQLAIARLPRSRRPDAFLTAWTAREAVGKTTGRGLAAELAVPPPGWTIRALPHLSGHIAAVAIARGSCAVRTAELTHEVIM